MPGTHCLEIGAWNKLLENLCVGQVAWKAVLEINCLESGTSIAGQEEHEEPPARDMLEERGRSIRHRRL